MKKIQDRFLLGLISGLVGGIAKLGVMTAARNLQWAEFDGRERAAGLLLPAHKVGTTRGKIIGNLTDLVMSCGLGIATIYTISAMGKDNAQLKGAAAGLFLWSGLYGVLGRLGFTSVTPASPKTVLSQSVAHVFYGVTAATMAITLGDEGLYNGRIPLNASSPKVPDTGQAAQVAVKGESKRKQRPLRVM